MEVKFEPAYTVGHDIANVTPECPVRVASWIAGQGNFRSLLPNDPQYPGLHYGMPCYCPESQDTLPHDHSHFEICIVRRGVAFHQTPFSTIELRENMVVVMAPGMVHSIYGLHDLHQTNIYYLTDWIADDLLAHWREAGVVPSFFGAALYHKPQSGEFPILTLTDNEMEKLDYELAQITEELMRKNPSLTILRSAMVRLLIQLARSSLRQSNTSLALGFRQEVMAAFESIERTVLAGEPLNVTELAGQFAMSPDYFSAVFRKSTGYSPMAYYQRRRVQHAASLLLDLRRSLTSIAFDLGYCDSSHFSHLFKQYQGMSPSEYRTQHAVSQIRSPDTPHTLKPPPQRLDSSSPIDNTMALVFRAAAQFYM